MYLPTLGDSPSGPFCKRGNRECTQFCSWGGVFSPGFVTDAFFLARKNSLLYAFPPIPFTLQNLIQNKKGLFSSDPSSTGMAPSILILNPAGSVNRASSILPIGSRDHFLGPWQSSPVQTPSSPFHSMKASWPTPFKDPAHSISTLYFLNSRKPSTRITYLAKWKCFSIWERCAHTYSGKACQHISKNNSYREVGNHFFLTPYTNSDIGLCPGL